MNPSRLLAGWILFSGYVGAVAGEVWYVGTEGKEGNPGSRKRPLPSLESALERRRERGGGGEIVLLPGVYFFARPVRIGPEDSGTRERPLVIRAEREGTVTLSAGVGLRLNWELGTRGVWRATVPADLVRGATGLDALRLNEESLRLARFPNFDPAARFLGGTSAEALAPGRVKGWRDPAGGFVHSLHAALWGGDHWRIVGRMGEGEVALEGGWMNNRPRGLHPELRFVENIFEELDAPGEWYLDRRERVLSVMPPPGLEPPGTLAVLSRWESILRFEGTVARPVRWVRVEGIGFRDTARTFMKTREPLLRSDWRIYRGGAVFLEGAEDVEIQRCEFRDLGGNGVFVSGYNRRVNVRASHFRDVGASAVCLVGRPSSVWNPMFDPYGKPVPWEEINRGDRGPRNPEYPAECVVEDCLMHDLGRVEKQVAGVQISMAHRVTVRHCSIYAVPRAGINIGEGAFGGHLVEWCDVFDTVRETGDHGSFNSWGRDRYWRLDYARVDREVAVDPGLATLDMLEPVTLRFSRWRCDHGWDIDLDDGSTWYVVTHNLCLGGGIKLREGYARWVENNVIPANTFHPHVWFEHSGDVFRRNIVGRPYEPIEVKRWGAEVDGNLFLDPAALERARQFGVDARSVAGDARFVEPERLDFRVAAGSPALAVGFENFPMDRFGVRPAALRKLARVPEVPVAWRKAPAERTARESVWLGARVKDLTTAGEVSATGMDGAYGVLVLEIPEGSQAAAAGLKARDVIVGVEGRRIPNAGVLLDTWGLLPVGGERPVEVHRDQRRLTLQIPRR